MRARTLTLGLVPLLCVLAGALALGSAPAWATETHVYAKSFAGEGTHVLSEPKGVAIDQETGDVYVVDGAKDTVEVFSATGTFVTTFGEKGTKEGDFEKPTEITVDNSGGLTQGDVYVVDSGNKRVEEFSSAGTYLGEVTKTELEDIPDKTNKVTNVETVAVDGSGDLWLWLDDQEQSAMVELPSGGSLELAFQSGLTPGPGLAATAGGDLWIGNATGAIESTPTGENLEHSVGLSEDPGPLTTGLALDPAEEDDVYVDRGTEVAHFASGSQTASDTFGSSGTDALKAGAGIAYRDATGEVYVADSTENRVDVYDAVRTVTEDALTVTKAGTGSGTVTCEANSSGSFGTCAAEYAEGTKLVLKGTAESGSTFEGWSSGTGSASSCTGTGNCSFTIAANSALTVTFNTAVATKDKLAVTKAGTGTGKVECEVNGAGGFVACATEYVEGTKLVLKGTAESGSEFAGWSSGSGSAAACTGTSNCSFTITANSALTATFNLIPTTKDKLTVTKAGTGTGKVECEANSSGSFGTCATGYAEGTKLVLKGTSESGSTFEGWSSGTGSASSCTGTNNCSFTITANSALTATFNTTPITKDKLVVTKAGTGTGEVECEVNSSSGFVPCVAEYNEGTKLVLKGVAAGGSTFAGWSAGTGSAGSCSGTSNCSFTITANSALTATFNLIPPTKDKLTVTKAGTGAGKVECEVNGADGFVACATEYAEGTKLVLRGIAEPGSEFAGWSGGTGSASSCTGTGNCSFTITANSGLTATFNLMPPTKDKLTVTKSGTGTGKVECEVNSSGSFVPCVAEYVEGTKLVLKETPEGGSTFAGWSSGSGSASVCSGTSTGTCSFTIAADSAITATWTPPVTPKDTLTITKTGAGTGKVECEVNGSGHFEGCAAEYPEGTKLVLKGIAEPGSTFEGWSSGSGSAAACTGTSNCSFTVTADSAITATFNLTVITKEGKLTVAGSALVSGGDALLKLSCSSAGACVGDFELSIEVRQGRETKTVVIGQGSYSLAAGQSETLKVRLSGFALQLVERFRTLDAKLTGSGGLNQTVKLLLERHHGHHHKHGLSGYGQAGKRPTSKSGRSR